MEKLQVIKIGGNVIDDLTLLDPFIADFSALQGLKILIHGGGKIATAMAENLGIAQTIIEGRRITDAETLPVIVMVYAGLLNKTIVAKLQAKNCDAIGLCGADGNLIRTKMRHHPTINYGFVGDIVPDGINTTGFIQFFNNVQIPVICSITHDGAGNLLNTNADTMASAIAIALSTQYDVSLTYCFEKNGVLLNVEDEASYLPTLNKHNFEELKHGGNIAKGMIPKLENAFFAINSGVVQVRICHAKHLKNAAVGTKIVS